ncbi:MAG TPA: hypothetical protein VFJ02_00785 [Vicinamibacterales bacterium]|nr:hypothetical protein [Vicinamibacterales bacterium]
MAYWHERFDVRLFVPAAVAIAFASYAGAVRFDAIDAVARIVSSLALLAQFRLWDDLADRERDRREHPNRVLVRLTDITPFAATCVWLGAFNLCTAAWHGGVANVCLLALLTAGGAIWYHSRPSIRSAATEMTLLAKYPLFVLILAGPPVASVWMLGASASAVYAAACAFELWHDAASPLRVHNS